MDKKAYVPIEIIIFFAIFTLIVCLIAGCAWSYDIPRDRAVNAIIGEAENQGFQGMLAVACGIVNRGTLHGVYGEHSPRVKNRLYSPKILNQANLAWSLATHPDIEDNCDFLGGATHWENIKAFGKPSWVYGMKETYRYKDHVFYKIIKRGE